MSSMITAAQWVPRGFAAPFPQKYTLDESEFERIAELAKLQLDDAEDDLKEAEEEAENLDKGANGSKVDDDQEMEVDGSKKKSKKKKATQIECAFMSPRAIGLVLTGIASMMTI